MKQYYPWSTFICYSSRHWCVDESRSGNFLFWCKFLENWGHHSPKENKSLSGKNYVHVQYFTVEQFRFYFSLWSGKLSKAGMSNSNPCACRKMTFIVKGTVSGPQFGNGLNFFLFGSQFQAIYRLNYIVAGRIWQAMGQHADSLTCLV